MHPVCLELTDDFKIHWYGVMMAVAFLAGFLNWRFVGRGEGRGLNDYADLLFWIILSGILGARLAYVAGHLGDYLDDLLEIVKVYEGGLSYYGGFLGAGVGIFLFARARREDVWRLLDLVVTSVPLAHVFGRMGCILNGCCHGKVHDGVLSLTYPARSLAWYTQLSAGRITQFASRSLPVHPTQLYEAAWNLALYLLLVRLYRLRKPAGFTTGVYLVGYPLGRFLVEFLRDDDRMKAWNGISVAQIVSIALFLTGLVILTVQCRRGPAADNPTDRAC